MQKQLPIGVQSFEKLIKGDKLYVDKTALIYKMTQEYNYVFLSRPRRFGKSLLTSTLEAYFQGRKELFQGLAVEQLEQKWTKYPVFHLDLNVNKYEMPESLVEVLDNFLVSLEKKYGTDSSEKSLAMRLSGYLTISGYDEEFELYSLDFPNREVERGFTRFLIPYSRLRVREKNNRGMES